jgi:hypothetical protein
MGKGLDGARKHNITGSTVGAPRVMPARRVVTKHASKSVNTHPTGNAFLNPGGRKATAMALASQQGQFKG